ncbi:MAG: epoxyqueuosine reductase [Aminipila sp.]
MDLKQHITTIIQSFVSEYENKSEITSKWDEPIVGFADAKHPGITELQKIVSDHHAMPEQIIKNATIIIAYFVPFTQELASTNKEPGYLASPEWAKTYEETNTMFGKLNQYLIARVKDLGFDADVSPEASTFNQETLISNWSQRHLARLAGLGTFGINNMLITNKGCCGRYSTVVTNLDVTPDAPIEEEYCLYKSKGICGICVKHCPSGALTLDGYDRGKCYEVCKRNAQLYKDFGSSYLTENGLDANSVGSEVCGKCLVNTPCTFKGYTG